MDRAYRLFWTIGREPPDGIRVTADVPDDWTETLDGMGCPTFGVPAAPGALIAITAIRAPGPTAADRIAWAMRQQFDDLTQVAQTPRGDGRVWTVHRPAGRLHARMFLPAPHDSIVMATIMTFAASAHDPLAAVAPVFDTVRVMP